MNNRNSTELNASSMADIAFLLLVFFLVTTTMNPDTGITVKLPAWSDTPPVVNDISKRNVFSVMINGQNELLVRGKSMKIEDLRQKAQEFIANPEKRMDLASAPNKAIISLKNDRATSYEDYLLIYNELKAAYRELWDAESMVLYGQKYGDTLTDKQKKEVRSKYPFILSEAEPSNFIL